MHTSLCAHYRRGKVHMCVFVQTVPRSVGHMERTIRAGGGSPAGELEAAEFLKRRTASSQSWPGGHTSRQGPSNTCGGRPEHLATSSQAGFITSESRLGFRLIRSKWTMASRSGPRLPAGHKVALSGVEPYVGQMLPGPRSPSKKQLGTIIATYK